MWKKIRSSIPPSRLVSYLIVLSALPFVMLALHFKSAWKELTTLQARILDIQEALILSEQKELINNSVRAHYQGSDHFYIDHHLETVPLLKKERAALEELMHNRAFTGSEMVEARYAFIEGEENRLLFNEGGVQKEEGIIETIEVLAHPVEMDNEDMRTVLSLIEDKKESQPQLLITEFGLQKKKSLGGNEVFDLNLKLLKREFEG